MAKINLRKYYPDFYTTDYIIEVPDEVAALMAAYERAEAAYYLRRYRHKAYYSLDRGDGIEHEILFVSLCSVSVLTIMEAFISVLWRAVCQRKSTPNFERTNDMTHRNKLRKKGIR